MLARSNVLCLDKTGTITDGTMTVKEVVLYNHKTEINIKCYIKYCFSTRNS